MSFDRKYFQQNFGMLDPNIKWPTLFKSFIDDGFGSFEGTRNEVEYWINQFKILRDTIKLDK